jgi:hypothetical protein
MGARNSLYAFFFRASSTVQMIRSERDLLSLLFHGASTCFRKIYSLQAVRNSSAVHSTSPKLRHQLRRFHHGQRCHTKGRGKNLAFIQRIAIQFLRPEDTLDCREIRAGCGNTINDARQLRR